MNRISRLSFRFVTTHTTPSLQNDLGAFLLSFSCDVVMIIHFPLGSIIPILRRVKQSGDLLFASSRNVFGLIFHKTENPRKVDTIQLHSLLPTKQSSLCATDDVFMIKGRTPKRCRQRWYCRYRTERLRNGVVKSISIILCCCFLYLCWLASYACVFNPPPLQMPAQSLYGQTDDKNESREVRISRLRMYVFTEYVRR